MSPLRFRAPRLLLLTGLFLAPGCATVGVIASSTQTFSLTDTVTVRPTDTARFFAGATSVGSSLGFRVSGEDQANSIIALSKGASEFTQVMIGKIEQVTVTLSLAADHKTIALRAQAMGNFDTASQASVSKVVADLKSGLAAQFGSASP